MGTNVVLNEMMKDLVEAIANAPLSDYPSLIGSLEQCKALAWSRLMAAGVADQRGMDFHEGKRLLTIPQAAEQLAIPKGRAYELARRGKLPIVRVGKYVRVEPTALARWISSHSESQGVDKTIYPTYSIRGDRQRAQAHPKTTRANAGVSRGQAGRRVELRGSVGAQRNGDARAGRSPGSVVSRNQGQTEG